MVTPKEFISALAALEFDNVFNPYSKRCAVHDVESAPFLRAEALQGVLESASNMNIDALWIGRDLGYRGGRRTGLALTDDLHVCAHAKRWGVEVQRATKGKPVAERTAAIIWSVLEMVTVPVFLWNVFPLHPHEPDDPFTNRSHNAVERRAGEELLDELVRLLRPTRLVAIGNDAAKTAMAFSGERQVITVRHPSYGGQNAFVRQVLSLYGVSQGHWSAGRIQASFLD